MTKTLGVPSQEPLATTVHGILVLSCPLGVSVNKRKPFVSETLNLLGKMGHKPTWRLFQEERGQCPERATSKALRESEEGVRPSDGWHDGGSGPEAGPRPAGEG